VAELALDFWTRRSVVGSPVRVFLLDACTGNDGFVDPDADLSPDS
jgi:hypothetical protein